MIRAPWWVWVSVLGCAAASLASIHERNKVESVNDTVGLMMEMADIEAIAAATGNDREATLSALKRNGLTGVAINEETIGDLVRKGRLILQTDGTSLVIHAVADIGGRWIKPGTPEPRYLGSQYQHDLYHLDRAAKALSRRGFFDLGVVNVPFRSLYPTSISVDRDVTIDVSTVLVGIDPRAAYEAKEAGLVVVARHFNEVGANSRIIVGSLRDSRDIGATAFLIGGDQAVGNRNQLGTTAETLRALNMSYLSPEFVSLGGDAYLRRTLSPQVMRLHSITQLEAETMSPSELAERFTKAFRERSIRWLLLRPTSKADHDVQEQVSLMLSDLKSAIEGVGGKVGEPKPFEKPMVPSWLTTTIVFLALPAVIWTIFIAIGTNWIGALGSLVALGTAGATAIGELVEVAALMIAVFMPVLGYYVISEPPTRPGWRTAMYPLLAYIGISFFSLVGGLAVGGMLVGVDYTLRVTAFTGVKVALFLPILLVGWIILKRLGPIKETLARPVTWIAATVTIFGLVVIAMLALRSGNENPSAVSGLEIQFRSLLDNVFLVRPRTKEFAFGHPILVLALCLIAYRPNLRGWGVFLLLAAMVGQTSIVNTMCHLHTPALLSLMRIGVGLLVGGIIGALAWLVVKRFVPVDENAN